MSNPLPGAEIMAWLNLHHPDGCGCVPCDAMRKTIRELALYECDFANPTVDPGSECPNNYDFPCPPCVSRRLIVLARV